MKCSACTNEATKSTDLCRNCLVRAIEKRARKELGKASLTKGMKIAAVNDGSCAGMVNEYLARKFITITPVKSIKKAKNGFDLVLTAETANDQAEKMMGWMLNSEKQEEPKNSAGMLRDSLLSEVKAYAAIKNIKYKADKRIGSTSGIIADLESKYKGATFSIARSYEKLR